MNKRIQILALLVICAFALQACGDGENQAAPGATNSLGKAEAAGKKGAKSNPVPLDEK
jgi:hypothetical protein